MSDGTTGGAPLELGECVGQGQSADVFALTGVGVVDERGRGVDAVCKRYRRLYAHHHHPSADNEDGDVSIAELREQFEAEQYMYAHVRELYYSAVTPNVVLSANWDSPYDLVLEQCRSSLFDTFHPPRFRRLLGRRIQCMDWYVVIFQVVHVLAVLQEELGLMHNDLHADNVFINLVDHTFEWHDFAGAQHNAIPYTMGSSRYLVPLRGFLVKLGDFNLACTYKPPGAERIYSGIARGRYSEYGMDGRFHAGYDMQVFLLNLLGFRKRFELPNEIVRFVTDLLDFLVPRHKQWYKRVLRQYKDTKFFRPAPRHVSDIAPSELLEQGVFDQLFAKTHVRAAAP